MENLPLEDVHDGRSGAFGIALVVFFGFVLGSAFGTVLWFSQSEKVEEVGVLAKSLLAQTRAVLQDTFRDALRRPVEEPVFEVDLAAEPLPQVDFGLLDEKSDAVTRELTTNQETPTSAASSTPTSSLPVATSTPKEPEVKKSIPPPKPKPAAAPPPQKPACGFSSGPYPTSEVILNEIAWMGSLVRGSETATQAANNEWFEIKNASAADVNLKDWTILDQDGGIQITFDKDTILKAGALLLFERTNDDSVPGISADKMYTGSFSNGGEWLKILNDKCELVDELNAAQGWPAGNNETKETLGRSSSRNSGRTLSWHTSPMPGGTPKAENVEPRASTAPVSTPYTLSVSKSGSGGGTVTSDIGGLNCGTTCSWDYVVGTTVVLTATPASDSVFAGWTGSCSGTGNCTLMLSGSASVGAIFVSALPTNVVISEVMAGSGGNSSNEFVELYNPTSQTVSLTGWSIKKKSSTGTESSLLVASRLEGKIIPAGKYFLAANEGGYTGSVVPDVFWATSNTVAYTSNAVILYDATGVKVDEVNWADIPQDQSYTRQSWTSATFAVQGTPTPQNSTQ